jgi:hypothetical protein
MFIPCIFIVYYSSFVPTNAHTRTHTHTHAHTHTHTHTHTHIYITNAPTCFGVATPFSGSWNIACWSYKILKLLQLHKAVRRCTVKSVLLIKCGSGCKCSSSCSFYSTGVQPFYDRAQQPLLWSSSWAARGKITVRGIPTSQNYSQMHDLQV